jgi:SAM-dependent methyltransferase
MTGNYDPKAYWDARLAQHSALRATGHISFGEGYNKWLYRAKERALERALAGRPLRGAEVLDVGCGNGYFVRWYREQGARVTGVDISPTGIERLRREYPGTYHLMDLSQASGAALGSFDVVNVWDVMYHIVDDAAFERALRYIASNVAPGGLLLVTDRMEANGDERVADHVRMRCLASHQRVLSGSGLELVSVQFLYRWLNRYVSHPLVDSRLGRFYYWLDGRGTRVPADNLSLGVWRRTISS